MGRLDYLKQYGSNNTVKAYQSALKNYFEMIYNERNGLDQLAERYFSENRNFEEDLQNFLVSLKSVAPKSANLKLAAVRMFLLENDIDLTQKFWRRLRGRIRGSRALTLDKVPSNEELRRIIMHLPIQGKALFLVLSSSGMRIGETMLLKTEDLVLNGDPVKVNIRGEYTKSGNSRVAFISGEAKEAVGEWLKTRDQYLAAAVGRSQRHEKQKTDERLFPFESNTAYFFWRNALSKSQNGEKDSRTHRSLMHPHVLRKFFRTRLGAVIPVDIVEALMGHEGYLTEVYRKYGPEELAKFYLKGEYALLVFTESGEVSKLTQKIEEDNKQLKQEVEEEKKQLQILVNSVVSENLELKSRVSKVELENTDLKKKIAHISETLEDVKRELGI